MSVAPTREVVPNGLTELHGIQDAGLDIREKDADLVELLEALDHRLVEVVRRECSFEGVQQEALDDGLPDPPNAQLPTGATRGRRPPTGVALDRWRPPAVGAVKEAAATAGGPRPGGASTDGSNARLLAAAGMRVALAWRGASG